MKNVKPSKYIVLSLQDNDARLCNSSEEAIEEVDEIVCEMGYDYVDEFVRIYAVNEEYTVKDGGATLVKRN